MCSAPVKKKLDLIDVGIYSFILFDALYQYYMFWQNWLKTYILYWLKQYIYQFS